MAQPATAAAAPAPAPAPGPSPRRTILEVEVFVVGATTLLVLQLIFGFWRRRSSSMWIQGPVWLAYTLTFPLVTYTFGLMQSSTAKSQLYPVWAIALFLASGCTNSVTAYDLDETKRWKKQLFEMGQQCVYSGLIFLLLLPRHISVFNEFIWTTGKGVAIYEYCYILLSTIMYNNMFRAVACWMATFPDHSKVVADYMRDLQVDSGGSRSESQQLQGRGSRTRSESEPDPIRMEGGRYLVQWYKTHGATAHDGYRTKLSEEDIVTVDMIWEKCSDMLPFDPSGSSQSKDVCLSFALFHLLKRRYFGINCYEAGLQKTRNFVLNGLLASEDGKRAFRIIEVELAFMHDFFFTKYACVYENEIIFFATFIMKAILIPILGVFVHQNFLSLKTQSKIIPVGTTKADNMITLAILGALLIVEVLQAMLYLASDWFLVSMACCQVREGPCQAMYSLLHKLIYMLRKRSLFKYWQDKLGQYSVIEGSRWHIASPPPGLQPTVNGLLSFIVAKICMLLTEIALKIWTCQYCRSIVQDVKLPDTVKREIASSLKSIAATDDHLTNGEASLGRNELFITPFKETLRRDDWDLIDTMLIWHIATNYCETGLTPAAEMHLNSRHGKLRHYREVATTLSRYSAYLMAFVPELLPGNPTNIRVTFDKVMQEATVVLYPGQEEDIRGRAIATRDKLTEALNRSRPSDQEDHNDTIFIRGLKLGKELEAHTDNDEIRWKVLAEFWAEIILYVAPSDNVRGHVERLANGGEFITHIWALLSHAGILTRPPSQASGVIPAIH